MPFELAYLWEWYVKLSRKRQGGFGPSPLSSEEIFYWCARRRITFTSFEHDVIDRLDELHMSSHEKKDE